MSSEISILVTGFGPFGNYETNASWEAAKQVYAMRDDLHKRHNVKLIIDHVPVVYDYVLHRVPQLWEDHEPQIVLHVGVSHLAKCLTIERRAHSTGYFRPDVNGKCPTDKCDESSSYVLETGIDINDLCRRINDNGKCEACTSDNAGRYLCEYIYYQSLCKNPTRTLFIHVPDFNVYTSEVTARGICEIIELLVEDMRKSSII